MTTEINVHEPVKVNSAARSEPLQMTYCVKINITTFAFFEKVTPVRYIRLFRETHRELLTNPHVRAGHNER